MYAQTVWPKATKFGILTQCGAGMCVLGGQSRSYFKGRDPSVPQFLGPYFPYKRFDLKRPNLIHGGVAQRRVSMSQTCRSAKGRGPQCAQNYCNPYLHQNGLTYSDENMYGDSRGRVAWFRKTVAPLSKEGRGLSVPKISDPTFAQTV